MIPSPLTSYRAMTSRTSCSAAYVMAKWCGSEGKGGWQAALRNYPLHLLICRQQGREASIETQ